MDKFTRRLRLYALAALSFLGVGLKQLSAEEFSPATVRDFSAGLKTREDAANIPDGAAQSLRDVDVWRGYVEKRRGSVKQNSSTIGSFTSQPVRFLHEYVDSSLNDWLLIVSSNSLYRSNDGGAAVTLITSTYGITSTSRFCGVSAFGNAYLTDGTTNWLILSGTTLSASTVPPKGLTCEFFGERLITSVGSTLYASRFGDATDWTADAGTDNDAFSQNLRQNNGYSIRAIKRFRNGLLVFKDYSLDLYTQSSDGLTFILTPLSNSIGTQYPESIAERENDVIWLAKDGFYSYNGSTIKKISDDIEPDVNNIIQLSSSERSWTQTLEADFTAGTLGSGLTATESSGDVKFSTQGYVLDAFTDGNFTADPVWTLTQSSISFTGAISGGEFDFSTTNGSSSVSGIGGLYGTTATFTTGYVVFDFTPVIVSTNAGTSALAKVVFSTNNVAGALTGFQVVFRSTASPSVLIGVITDGVGVVTSCIDVATFNQGTTYRVRISRDSSSVWRIYSNDVLILSCTDSTYTDFSSFHIGLNNSGAVIGNREVKYDNVRVSTGAATFQSQAFNIGTGITSWGIFDVANVLNSGTLSYAVYTDTNSAITISNSTTWISSQSVTAGAVPSVATAAWVTWTAAFARSDVSYEPTLNQVTVNWTEGGAPFPVSALYFENDYICSVSTSNTSYNDTMFVYDSNGSWTLYKYPAYYLKIYRQKPYFGSGIQGDIVRFQADDIYQDYDGSAISSYWVSKEFDFGYPLTKKTITRYYVTAKYRADSTGLFEWGVNRGDKTSESTLSSVTNGVLDLDNTTGFFRKSIVPSSLTYKSGLTHSFKISNSVLNERFDLLSVTMKADLETSP